MKCSKISSIPKIKDTQSDPGNFRPIAQLSPFSKIIEKLITKQITEFLDRNQVLVSHQFGFRAGHSTHHPLMLTKDFIQTELQKKREVALISLDLRKAFDKVRTDGTLQNKIRYYLQNDNITDWFISYFKNRKQFTNWNNEN